MAYNLTYQLNNDIDIFLKICNRYIIHIASAGAVLPSELAALDELLIQNKSIIYDFDSNSEIEININPYLNELLKFKTTQEKDLYLTDFIRIARKGIITFDKTVVEDSTDPFYHLVAWPRRFQLYNIKALNPIETPVFISNKIETNILKHFRDNNRSIFFGKFELLKNI